MGLIRNGGSTGAVRGKAPGVGGQAHAGFPRPHDHTIGVYASTAANAFSGWSELVPAIQLPAYSMFAGFVAKFQNDVNAVGTIEFATGAAGGESVFFATPIGVWYTGFASQYVLSTPIHVGSQRVAYRLMGTSVGFQAYVKALFLQGGPNHHESWSV